MPGGSGEEVVKALVDRDIKANQETLPPWPPAYFFPS